MCTRPSSLTARGPVKEINALISSFSATYRARARPPAFSEQVPFFREPQVAGGFYQVTAKVSPWRSRGYGIMQRICRKRLRLALLRAYYGLVATAELRIIKVMGIIDGAVNETIFRSFFLAARRYRRNESNRNFRGRIVLIEYEEDR